jgi:hypothetical protein
METQPNNGRSAFESVIQALEADIANAASHMAVDAKARQIYVRQIWAMADDLRLQATSGRITWAQLHPRRKRFAMW